MPIPEGNFTTAPSSPNFGKERPEPRKGAPTGEPKKTPKPLRAGALSFIKTPGAFGPPQESDAHFPIVRTPLPGIELRNRIDAGFGLLNIPQDSWLPNCEAGSKPSNSPCKSLALAGARKETMQEPKLPQRGATNSLELKPPCKKEFQLSQRNSRPTDERRKNCRSPPLPQIPAHRPPMETTIFFAASVQASSPPSSSSFLMRLMPFTGSMPFEILSSPER